MLKNGTFQIIICWCHETVLVVRGISNVGKTHVNFELLQYQLGNLFTPNEYRRIFNVKGLFGFIINEIGFIWLPRFVRNFCAVCKTAVNPPRGTQNGSLSLYTASQSLYDIIIVIIIISKNCNFPYEESSL